MINSIKKIFLIIKWFFVWVYRKIKQFCKRVWRRQDLLLCIATLIMVGYATFWRYDNKSFDGKEVWWGISVIIGLVVALVIGIVGYRILFRYALPLYLVFSVVHLFQRKPMIEKEFEATLRNLFLNGHSAESTVELVLMLLTAFLLATFERRNRALFRKEREEKEREKSLTGRRARRMKKKNAIKQDEEFHVKHFPCIISGTTVLVMMFSYLFSGFMVRVVCITVTVFALTVYTAPLVRKVRAVLFATAGFVFSFHHELAILKYNKANGSYFLKWMAERGSLPNILIWEKFGLIGYCLVVAAVLSILWFIWRAWRYANKKGNVCDEVISITAFVHFALAGTYFVAEMAFPEGNYFWGNNLPFFTGTIENNLLYLAELGIVYRILRKALGNRRQIPSPLRAS